MDFFCYYYSYKKLARKRGGWRGIYLGQGSGGALGDFRAAGFCAASARSRASCVMGARTAFRPARRGLKMAAEHGVSAYRNNTAKFFHA